MPILKVYIVLIVALVASNCEILGQSTSFGNTYIHHNGEAVVFGLHDFDIGGDGTLPGIVGTQREEDFGIFSFSDVSQGWINASDDRYIDGYVKTYSDQAFVFPIGDNGRYRPIAISGAAETRAAYFSEDPDLAMTDDLFGGIYPALPIGGPFPTDQKTNGIYRVSQVEYWDIDGTQPTRITLTWDIFSEVDFMTAGDINRLTIIAWDGNQWVSLPSMIDVLYLNNNLSTPSYTAGLSTRTQGSITINQEVIPDQYIAYTLGAIASGFIGDFVWDDLNRNGIQDAGEPGLEGVVIELYNDETGELIGTTESDINGRYVFEGIPPGRYYLMMTPPPLYSVTLPGKGLAATNSDLGFTRKTAPFTLEANMIEYGMDGGFYKAASIGDYVWLDLNGDGIQQSDELPLPNMRIELLDSEGALLASTITNQEGRYTFTNLPPRDYYIRIILTDDYGYAPYKATLDEALDSDINPLTGRSELITLISGDIRTDIDIGVSQSCPYSASVEIIRPDCGTTNGQIIASVVGNSGPFTYLWSNGDTTQSIVGLDTGLYTLVIKDNTGCTRVFSERVTYGVECSMVCATLETSVYLEGAYDIEEGRMHTELNDLGYLPGQVPTTFFGKKTEPGQPYSRPPFNYLGIEGIEWESMIVSENNRYLPEEMTDWVLVSLRVVTDEEYETCTRAGMLLNDGTIEFLEDDCCLVDPSLEYYVVIEHRNHLIVMSPTPLPVVNDTIKYDFRSNTSYRSLLGFTQKGLSTGVNAMYAGNGDQYLSIQSPVDINVNDVSEWLKENGLHSSYYFMDFDLNGDVNVQDKTYYLNNIGVFTDVPKGR